MAAKSGSGRVAEARHAGRIGNLRAHFLNLTCAVAGYLEWHPCRNRGEGLTEYTYFTTHTCISRCHPVFRQSRV